jgi:hypothetical protein
MIAWKQMKESMEADVQILYVGARRKHDILQQQVSAPEQESNRDFH